ncbi:hypothetical protein HZA57_02020 [Candidatus Poribacteria bacterium]|nr:hypothetical protein [Candidatus Poribacteria bacterium]
MPNRPLTAYLAGAIEYAPDGGTAWRREFAEWAAGTLGHKVHDPSTLEHNQLLPEEIENFRTWKRTDFPRFQRAIRKIIHHDLRLVLEHTDYIVCRWCEGTRMGGGTHGELTLAYWHQIPVFLKLDVPRESVSSWILGCATHVFDDWEPLREMLRAQYARERSV